MKNNLKLEKKSFLNFYFVPENFWLALSLLFINLFLIHLIWVEGGGGFKADKKPTRSMEKSRKKLFPKAFISLFVPKKLPNRR